jgi:hypothetical protein
MPENISANKYHFHLTNHNFLLATKLVENFTRLNERRSYSAFFIRIITPSHENW